MAEQTKDLEEMLIYLGLPVSAVALDQLQRSPKGASFSPMQYLRSTIEPQVIETKELNFRKCLRNSRLGACDSDVSNLRTGNGRIYDDNLVRQLLSFEFLDNGRNVNVFGVTDAGKSYFLSAFCIEACRREIDCRFLDYVEFMEDMSILHDTNEKSFKRKLKSLSKVRLLFIDDFAINRYSENQINILYRLLKARTDNKVSTMISCQYDPEEWGMHLSKDKDCYGKLDGLRRRLISNGYYVLIQKVGT